MGIIKSFLFFSFFIGFCILTIIEFFKFVSWAISIFDKTDKNTASNPKKIITDRDRKSNIFTFFCIVFCVSVPLYCIYYFAMSAIVGTSFLE